MGNLHFQAKNGENLHFQAKSGENLHFQAENGENEKATNQNPFISKNPSLSFIKGKLAEAQNSPGPRVRLITEVQNSPGRV